MYERDWTEFHQENFIFDYFSIEWDQILCIDSNGIEKSFKNFLDKFDSLLDLYAPYKKLSKSKLKFIDKPWIASGIQKSIPIKNHYLKKFNKLKDPHINSTGIFYQHYIK